MQTHRGIPGNTTLRMEIVSCQGFTKFLQTEHFFVILECFNCQVNTTFDREQEKVTSFTRSTLNEFISKLSTLGLIDSFFHENTLKKLLLRTQNQNFILYRQSVNFGLFYQNM